MIKLLKYMKKYWFIALLAPTFMIGEVAMDLFLSQYMEYMIDFGIQTGNMNNVIKYGFIMLAIVLIGVTCGVLSGVFTNIASFRFSNDLRKATYQKIMQLSYDQIDTFNTGSLVTRVTNEITQIQNMVSMALRMFIRAASFFVLGIVFTLSISIRFGFVLAIILPIEVIVIIIFARFAFPIFSIIQKKLDRVNTIVHENVTGARVVKAFGKEDYEYDRFVEANNEYTELNLKVSRLMALLMPIMTIIIFGAQIAIYEIGGESILNVVRGVVDPDHMLMVGEISQAITYISMICMSVMMLAMTFTNMARAFASAKRVNEILDCNLEIIDGSFDPKDKKEKGTIMFKNVGFKNPLSQGEVLSNMNFTIHQGETIAIVGSTGSGKSSLVNLIPRFYDTTSGEIYVDGVNVKEYKAKDLRNIVSICLQKSELFAGTIRDNIAWGTDGLSDSEVLKAASIAQAMDFINSKEKGFMEYVEEKGTSLSGGQKQRLAIARAIARKPEILIFDDSTSALDLVTEANLYQAMHEKMNDVTKIIVAQRIASVKNADRIIVLDNGRIVDFGTHDELMEKSLVYQDIYNSQLKKDGEIYE